MLVLFIVFAAFFVVCVESVIALMKKISTGRFDAAFREMDEEMRRTTFPICLGIGCTVFPLFFTFITFHFLKAYSLIFSLFTLSAHIIFRLLTLGSDIAASRYPTADHEFRRLSARRARRFFLFILGLFAIVAAAIITFALRNKLLVS